MLKRSFIACALGTLFTFGSVVVTPNVASAAKLTAEEKQAKKDEKNLETIQKKIKDAEEKLAEENYSRAKSALKAAVKAHDKMSDGFQSGSEVVKLKKKLDKMVADVEQQEVNGKRAKSDEKALASLKKEQNKIEEYITKKQYHKLKSPQKNVDRYFGKLSDEYKASKEGVTLKKQLDKMLADVDKKVADGQQADKDGKATKNLERKIDQAQENLDKKMPSFAFDATEKAKQYYEHISDAGKKLDNVKKLKSKLDKLSATLAKIQADEDAQQKLRTALNEEQSNFYSYINTHHNALTWLAQGKYKDRITNTDINDVEKFKEKYAVLSTTEKELRALAKNMIQEKDDTQKRGFSVADVLELLKNKETYRNTFVDVSANQWLDKMIEKRKELVETLNKQGTLWRDWVVDIYGENKNTKFKGVISVESLYKWIGKKAPKAKIDAIAAYKPKLRKLVESAAKSNKWKQSKYPQVSKGMKKLGKRIAKNDKIEFVGAGRAKNVDWKVVKHELTGIPLYKHSKGILVFRHKGEPFARGYEVSFKKHYDGTKYDDVTEAKFDYDVIPFKK